MEDAAFLRHLYERARPDTALMAAWPAALRRQVLDQQFVAQQRDYAGNYPDATRLVITDDCLPVGRLIVDRPSPAMTRDWCIVDIAVLPEHRGRGIGEAVLRGILHDAGAASASVMLTVRMNNPAQRLYTRLGFCVIDGEPPDLVMRWTPPSTVN